MITCAGYTATHEAAQASDPFALREIYKYWPAALTSIAAGSSDTVLHYAVRSGYADQVSEVMNMTVYAETIRIADPESASVRRRGTRPELRTHVNFRGMTAVSEAAAIGRADILQVLLCSTRQMPPSLMEAPLYAEDVAAASRMTVQQMQFILRLRDRVHSRSVLQWAVCVASCVACHVFTMFAFCWDVCVLQK